LFVNFVLPQISNMLLNRSTPTDSKQLLSKLYNKNKKLKHGWHRL